MTTIALRFSDNFAPGNGTIKEHQKVIDEKGYVWYGKLGTPLAPSIIKTLMENDQKKILLIHSGKAKRYWAYYSEVKRTIPELQDIPFYYRDKADSFSTWFRIVAIEKAPDDVLSMCTVKSSGNTLSNVSRHSMSPYFIIEERGNQSVED